MDLEMTSLPIKRIQLPERALKEHPQRQIRQIADSIQAFGFNDPVAVDEHNALIEGVGRVLAAKTLGLKTIPVIVLRHLSPAQRQAYRIAHNKICLNSDFNLEALRMEFEALSQLDPALLGLTGFEPSELQDLMTPPPLPELNAELSGALQEGASLVCPHCGGTVYV